MKLEKEEVCGRETRLSKTMTMETEVIVGELTCNIFKYLTKSKSKFQIIILFKSFSRCMDLFDEVSRALNKPVSQIVAKDYARLSKRFIVGGDHGAGILNTLNKLLDLFGECGGVTLGEDAGANSEENPDKSEFVAGLLESISDTRTVRVLKLTNQAILAGGIFALRTHASLTGVIMTDDRSEEGWRIRVCRCEDGEVEVTHLRREICDNDNFKLRWELSLKVDSEMEKVMCVRVAVTSINENSRDSLEQDSRRLGEELGLLDRLPLGGVIYEKRVEEEEKGN